MNEVVALVFAVLACLSLSIGTAKAITRILDIYNTWQFERLMRREVMEANLRG